MNEPTCPIHGIVYLDGRCAFCEDEENMKAIRDHDPVNSPSHYTAYKGLEIIDLTEQLNFNRGNAIKYIARAGLKNKTPEGDIEDLKKAVWYINREIKRVEEIEEANAEEGKKCPPDDEPYSMLRRLNGQWVTQAEFQKYWQEAYNASNPKIGDASESNGHVSDLRAEFMKGYNSLLLQENLARGGEAIRDDPEHYLGDKQDAVPRHPNGERKLL